MKTKIWEMRGYRQKIGLRGYTRRYTAVSICWGCDKRVILDRDFWLDCEDLEKFDNGETVSVWVSGGSYGNRGWTYTVSKETIRAKFASLKGISGDFICPACWEILKKRTPGNRVLVRQTTERAERDTRKRVPLKTWREWESGATIKLYEHCEPKLRAAIIKRASKSAIILDS